MALTAHNIYLLMARDVITDPEDGMSSIIKVIDRFTFGVAEKDFEEQKAKLNPGQSMAVPIPYFIATYWALSSKLVEKTPVSIQIEIIDPSGVSLGGPTQDHTVPVGFDKVGLNFKLDSHPLTSAGVYRLHAAIHLAGTKKLLAEADYQYEVELKF